MSFSVVRERSDAALLCTSNMKVIMLILCFLFEVAGWNWFISLSTLVKDQRSLCCVKVPVKITGTNRNMLVKCGSGMI